MSTVCSSQILDSTGAKVDAETRPYDVNFCFPVQDLEDESFKLTPFIPSVHAELFVIPSLSDPDIYNYLPFGPFSSAECFTKQLIEGRIQPNPGCILFAILHKGKPSLISGSESDGLSLAGTIGLLNTDPSNLCTELGFIIVLPAFRGAPTFAASHAVHLLLAYCLDMLRLRRVEWKAHGMARSGMGKSSDGAISGMARKGESGREAEIRPCLLCVGMTGTRCRSCRSARSSAAA